MLGRRWPARYDVDNEEEIVPPVGMINNWKAGMTQPGRRMRMPSWFGQRSEGERIRRKWDQPVGLLIGAKRASIEGFIHPNSREDLESDNCNPKDQALALDCVAAGMD